MGLLSAYLLHTSAADPKRSRAESVRSSDSDAAATARELGEESGDVGVFFTAGGHHNGEPVSGNWKETLYLLDLS